jgi:hypothetical protein
MTGVVVIVIPLLSLVAVLVVRNSAFDPRFVALIAATAGTTWRTWGDGMLVGEKLVQNPGQREAVLHDLGPGFWAWGLVCGATWLGLFSLPTHIVIPMRRRACAHQEPGASATRR